MKNKVTHFEIPANDLEQARKFYGEVFGWEFNPWDENYIMVTATDVDDMGAPTEPGSINGGLQKRGSRAPAPTLVISVEDIDKTLSKIEELGGKAVVSKEMIGDMGCYAQFEDPEGNRIGLFEVDM